jgi:hypothetical protein
MILNHMVSTDGESGAKQCLQVNIDRVFQNFKGSVLTKIGYGSSLHNYHLLVYYKSCAKLSEGLLKANSSLFF